MTIVCVVSQDDILKKHRLLAFQKDEFIYVKYLMDAYRVPGSLLNIALFKRGEQKEINWTIREFPFFYSIKVIDKDYECFINLYPS